MPGGAPAPMQFAPLQFAQAGPGMGQQMQNLGKNLASASKAFQPTLPDVTSGAAVPGAAGPSAVGGPAGPSPLVQPGQAALPGTPYSPQAGPVAPPGMAAPVGAPGSPYAGPMAPGQGPSLPPQLDPAVANMVRTTPAPMLLDWLKRTAGLGPMQPSLPGAAASLNAGMLPSQGFTPPTFGG